MSILEVEKGGVRVKMLCDGILCDIARAASRVADTNELIEAVLREFDHDIVRVSWRNYFTLFSDVICKERNKPVIDIARTEMKLIVADIVKHMKSYDKTDDLEFLMMPWNYKTNLLESDAEILARKVVEVNSNNVTEKMSEMEKRIDIKNRGYFESLKSEMKTMLSDIVKPAPSVPSYSNVARGAMGPPPTPSPMHLPSRGRSSVPISGQSNVAGFNLRRERSQSASKRPRVEDDDPFNNSEVPASQNRSHSKTRKYLVGTLNTKEASGRKMKSPPGDIFIYGVHPDTTEEDIVNDLKESDIIIETKDVVKKSRPDSGLNSYKISVKAEDLQKALDPSIWPMRVKVREYIYYARKPGHGSQQGLGGGQYGRHHEAQGGQGGGQGQYQVPHGPSAGQGVGGYGGAHGDRRYQGYHRPQGGQYGAHHEPPGGHSGQQQAGHHGVQIDVPTFNRFEGLDTRP